MEFIAEILTGLGALLAVIFSYGQYDRNKKTDLKIEKWRREETKKSKRRFDNAGKIYGALWTTLSELKADRVFIIQPHPLIDSMFVSITFEAVLDGVESMKDLYQHIKISEIYNMCDELAEKDFIVCSDVDVDIKDRRARSILTSHGITCGYAKKLSNSDYDWVGTLVISYMEKTKLNSENTLNLLNKVANRIQYIIPPIEENKESL